MSLSILLKIKLSDNEPSKLHVVVVLYVKFNYHSNN